MNIRGLQISIDLLLSLHQELLLAFSKLYSLETKTLTVFQLYGFGQYSEDKPSLKSFIAEITGQQINGKYLYNKVKEVERGNSQTVKLRRDYLSLLILTAGYESYTHYLEESPFVSKEIREKERSDVNQKYDESNTVYYVGYYVEDRRYYVKSKFTIHNLKTATWEILYWENDYKPSYYTYFGKCVPIGESALSFYFNKENSSLNKECFVNIFYGNNMQIKPILLGAYCGFSRSNSPVIGKLIFEYANGAEEQEKKALSKEINPIFHHYLYSQRMEVASMLPHKDTDLSNSLNRISIVHFLIGKYLGFYLDRNNYLIPVSFEVLNDLAEIKLKINNTSFSGIGRINSTENSLISEFSGENHSYSQFSIQVQPLERDLFLGHSLVYGANVLNGRVLLWKNNQKLQEFMEESQEFYLNKADLDNQLAQKIAEYLAPDNFRTSVNKNLS